MYIVRGLSISEFFLGFYFYDFFFKWKKIYNVRDIFFLLLRYYLR